jgi:hypothetical protein
MTPTEPTPLEPAVSTALTSLQARKENRVAHVETGFAPGANGTVRFTATWRPVPGFKDRPERLRVEIRDAAGAAIASSEAELAADGTGVLHVDVPVGQVVVRYSASGASGDVVDRWEAPLTVPDLSGATLAVGTPEFLRARTTAAFQALRRGEPGVPSPDREFRPTDMIVVRASVAHTDGSAATVVAELLTREGKALASLPAVEAGGQHQIELPVRSLALGEYVLRFTATQAGHSASATTGFALVR